MSLSGAGLSHPARASIELFQYLLQFARRAHVAALFPTGKSGPVRSSPLDDHGKRHLVHRGIPLRNPTSAAAQTWRGKRSHASGCSHNAKRTGGPSEETPEGGLGRETLARSNPVFP